MKKNIQQGGFTLIELVVVIVILGILAATALPRFIDLGGDARAGVMRGVESSMRSANTMLYAKAAAQNQLSSTGTITVNGANVAVVFGYAANVAALASVMDLNPTTDFTIDTTNGAIQHAGATTAASCQIAYTAAASATSAPVYAATLTAC